jgi:hypothetical protein
MKLPRPKLSYANVTATVALFIALGGGALAATHLARNSVGTSQLRKSAVTTPKIKRAAVTTAKLASHAVTGEKVATGSLTAADLAPGTIPSPIPRTARLQSGETITGFVAIENAAAGGSDFFGAAAAFPILPQISIPEKLRIMVTGSSAPNCPGKGQAAPGYLCVYQVQTQDAKEPNIYPEAGLKSEAATYGFLLQVESETSGTVLYGADWAYTER